MNLYLEIRARPGGLDAALVFFLHVCEPSLEDPYHFIGEVGDLDEVQVDAVFVLKVIVMGKLHVAHLGSVVIGGLHVN